MAVNIGPWAIVVVLVLAILAYPLGFGLTTQRLAFLLIIAWLVYDAALKNAWSFARSTFVLVLVGAVIFALSALSFLISGGKIWSAASWLFLSTLGACIAESLRRLQRREIEMVFVLLGAVALAILLGVMLRLQWQGVLLGSGFWTRRWFDENVTYGLSRFMNGVAVLSLLAFAAWWGGVAKGVLIRGLLLTPVFLVCILALLSGSRQTILAIMTFGVVLGGLSWKSIFRPRNLKIILVRVTVGIGCAALGIGVLIRRGIVNLEWIEKRFLTTIAQGEATSSDETRVWIWSVAADAMFENNGFGIGLGRFADLYGLSPHNGYLGIMAGMGVLAGGAALAVLAGTLVFVLRRCIKSGDGWLNTAVATVLIVLVVVMANLNDIIQEPLFWAVLGLVTGMAEGGRAGMRGDRRFYEWIIDSGNRELGRKEIA